MYHTITIQINPYDALFLWCDTNAHYANNLYNAALFRQRQLMSSVLKDASKLTPNELEVLKEIEFLKQFTDKTPSNSGYMSYVYLDALFKHTKNIDYYASGFPIHSAQDILKDVCNAIKGFYESLKSYKANPSKFKKKPNWPSYKRKNGKTSFRSSNQDCIIRKSKKGRYFCSFPKTKERICLGKSLPGRFIELHVTPKNNVYILSFVFDDEKEVEPLDLTERIISVDPGVNNLMAITNNCDLPCLLFNGRPLKSINQYYNKQIANVMSSSTKGSTDKFKATKKYQALTLKRNNQVKDYLLKSAKILINWCVENRIDTIVLGKNADWKQESSIGRVNNQNFVLIPHSQLYKILLYSADRVGIKVVEQEESYTSKASFLDRDEIPTFGSDSIPKFSGKRIKRGLYKSKDKILNADLNGSANILRKCFPNAFKKDPDFNNIKVVKHPDLKVSL